MSEGGGVVLEGALLEKEHAGKIRIANYLEIFGLHLNDYPTNHPRILYMKTRGSMIEIWHRVSQYNPDHRLRLIPAASTKSSREKGDSLFTGHRLLELDTSNMSRKEIRDWIDTEGNIYVPPMDGRRNTQFSVVQKHREPLDAFARGVAELGVRCRVRQDEKGLFVARVTDIQGIAKVIREVGPFRTPLKVDQVRRFMERLTAERKARAPRRVNELAKSLLGL
jgi:hypothetical protein